MAREVSVCWRNGGVTSSGTVWEDRMNSTVVSIRLSGLVSVLLLPKSMSIADHLKGCAANKYRPSIFTCTLQIYQEKIC